MRVLPTIAVAVWVMLPAYLPNNVAVVAGGGRTIDGGRSWRGRRVLGDGKTWRGTVAGIVVGAVVAVALNAARAVVSPIVGVGMPFFPPAAALTLPAGAMLGDIAASFVKRRVGRERGAAFPVVDQLDFVVGAIVLTALVVPAWVDSVFSLGVLLAVVVLTPVLHVATNAIGFLLGLKDRPY